MKGDIDKIRMENIIDMAVLFSGMIRVLKKGSKDRIVEKIKDSINEFFNLSGKKDYIKKHENLCMKIIEDKKIKTAKGDDSLSWGQSAKIVDITMKVIFYYCKLPSEEYALKILPWLNGPIDSKILRYIKHQIKEGHLKKYENIYYEKIAEIQSLKDIDKQKYRLLQKIFLDCKERGNENMSLIEYEEIIWWNLKKKN